MAAPTTAPAATPLPGPMRVACAAGFIAVSGTDAGARARPTPNANAAAALSAGAASAERSVPPAAAAPPTSRTGPAARSAGAARSETGEGVTNAIPSGDDGEGTKPGATVPARPSAATPTTRRTDPRDRLRSDMVGRTRPGHKTPAGPRGDRGGTRSPTVTP